MLLQATALKGRTPGRKLSVEEKLRREEEKLKKQKERVMFLQRDVLIIFNKFC